MATEDFNYVIKELYPQYIDFIEFKNSEEQNKGKDSLSKPGKINISFVEYCTIYTSWLRSQNLYDDLPDADNYDNNGLPIEDTEEEEEGSY